MQKSTDIRRIAHLIRELRQAAIDNGIAAYAREDGGFGLCLGAELANDAADMLEALLTERTGNVVALSPQANLRRERNVGRRD